MCEAGLSLQKYAEVFEENEATDWDTISELTADDLKEMGVKAVAARRKILNAIHGKPALDDIMAESHDGQAAEVAKLEEKRRDVLEMEAAAKVEEASSSEEETEKEEGQNEKEIQVVGSAAAAPVAVKVDDGEEEDEQWDTFFQQRAAKQ
uniref:SAM domain-containing protein n=1 Tax=Palpitomonas bilix TaxID=652834 RepID=A0A7S3DA51_9EUKA|mmetsp:Transcript_28813/g.73782  ORF Transcript_28813/g.73782 Transcript_28813/m.73782 type:complete len:150 (+) Transcript_28813:1495-1944(+)